MHQNGKSEDIRAPPASAGTSKQRLKGCGDRSLLKRRWGTGCVLQAERAAGARAQRWELGEPEGPTDLHVVEGRGERWGQVRPVQPLLGLVTSCRHAIGTGESLESWFLNLFLAALGFCCCTQASSSWREQGCSLVAIRRLLPAVISLVGRAQALGPAGPP